MSANDNTSPGLEVLHMLSARYAAAATDEIILAAHEPDPFKKDHHRKCARFYLSACRTACDLIQDMQLVAEATAKLAALYTREREDAFTVERIVIHGPDCICPQCRQGKSPRGGHLSAVD